MGTWGPPCQYIGAKHVWEWPMRAQVFSDAPANTWTMARGRTFNWAKFAHSFAHSSIHGRCWVALLGRWGLPLRLALAWAQKTLGNPCANAVEGGPRWFRGVRVLCWWQHGGLCQVPTSKLYFGIELADCEAGDARKRFWQTPSALQCCAMLCFFVSWQHWAALSWINYVGRLCDCAADESSPHQSCSRQEVWTCKTFLQSPVIFTFTFRDLFNLIYGEADICWLCRCDRWLLLLWWRRSFGGSRIVNQPTLASMKRKCVKEIFFFDEVAPGEEVEPSTFVMPLWAFDQFVVSEVQCFAVTLMQTHRLHALKICMFWIVLRLERSLRSPVTWQTLACAAVMGSRQERIFLVVSQIF